MFTIKIFGDVLAGFNASFIKLTNKNVNTCSERLSFHEGSRWNDSFSRILKIRLRHLSSQYMKEKLAYQWNTGSSSAATLHACMLSRTFVLCFLFHLKDWVVPIKPEVVIRAVQKNSAVFLTRAC